MVRDMTKEDLIDKGTQLSTVARYEKAKTRIFLLAVLKDTIDYVEANKTLNQNQMQSAVDELMKEFWYFKLEEIVYLLDKLKYQKFYERLKYGEIRDYLIKYEETERSYIIDSIIDSRKEYEENKVDYGAYKEWQKENPPKKRRDESDYNNYKAQYNATNQRCKSIAFKIYAGTKLIPSEEHFYKKNKTTIELLRLSLSKRV